MHLITQLLNRQPATQRLERWVPRANRTPALPPIPAGVQARDGEVLELDLREANPVIRRVAS